MDARLRRARQDWLSQGDVRAGLRSLDDQDLSPLEALRHPWLEDRDLRLAYGEHLASRGSALGEWIAASTRLDAAERLSLEDEWELRQRSFALLDANGEAWTGGRRSSHCEFDCKHLHPWRLEGGRLTPTQWSLSWADLAQGSVGAFRSRGAPMVKISADNPLEPPDLRAFAGVLGDQPWLEEIHALELRLREELPWSDEIEKLSFAESFKITERTLRYAQPPVPLETLLGHLPRLRDFRLDSSDCLPAWVTALGPRLVAFSVNAGLQSVAKGDWPRLRRLNVGHYLSCDSVEPEPPRLRPEAFPRLEELLLHGTPPPPDLRPIARQLRSLSLSPDLSCPIGGAPPEPMAGVLGPLFAGADFQRLEDLTLYGYRTTAQFLQSLGRISGLRRLELLKTGLDDQAASALGNLEGLRSLKQGILQPLTRKGLSDLLAGRITKTLRDLDISGGPGQGFHAPTKSNYPLAGAQVLHDRREHGLTQLTLTYLTRRSARVLATAPALRSLCSLRVGDLRGDAEAICAALSERSVFRLTKFEVDSPKSNAEEHLLREHWGWRYVGHGDYDFDFSF